MHASSLKLFTPIHPQYDYTQTPTHSPPPPPPPTPHVLIPVPEAKAAQTRWVLRLDLKDARDAEMLRIFNAATRRCGERRGPGGAG